MDVDRKFIEKKDFSTSRRGYDPEEVDSHLKAIAELVEEARREHRSARLAGAAADQVRTIVEAAERSAAEIQEKAELQAKRTQREIERLSQEARSLCCSRWSASCFDSPVRRLTTRSMNCRRRKSQLNSTQRT